eukprot:763303-Hanusia_phi.AAC.14
MFSNHHVCGNPASRSKGSKSVKQAASDPLKCGVCMAVVDEIQKELQTTENSTSTLDLRWGLTAEVTEGRAKRIGKVIPYKRSELRSIEVGRSLYSLKSTHATVLLRSGHGESL